MVSESATRLAGVHRFAVAAIVSGQATQLAGSALTTDEMKQAQWAFDNGKAVGIAVKDGHVVLVKSYGARGNTGYLPLGSGVVVLSFGSTQPEAGALRMLAALIGLADLLLDRRRAALEAERAREFQASDRLKAAILSSLSHELKSPIAALRAGLTALTAPQAGLQPEQRELLRDLDGQATRLDRLVGDMLALSRLEAGIELEREPHRFADLVGTALHQLRPDLKGREVTLTIADDLPPVEVDELQVGRVLTNLIENANEWAPADGKIAVGASANEDTLTAWVENDGPAIAPNDLDRVFERSGRGAHVAAAWVSRSPSAWSKPMGARSAPRIAGGGRGSRSHCLSPA